MIQAILPYLIGGLLPDSSAESRISLDDRENIMLTLCSMTRILLIRGVVPSDWYAKVNNTPCVTNGLPSRKEKRDA